MKLKEIPQNTIVYTPTEDEARELLAILCENGYKCGANEAKEEGWETFGSETCYRIYSDEKAYYTCNRKWYKAICQIYILPLLSLAEFKEQYYKEETPQPKFRVGDKVRWGICDTIYIIDEVSTTYKIRNSNGLSYSFATESDLIPYTEPETKEETMEAKELNLCELLAGHEGESIFLTTLGNVIIHSVSERSVQFKAHETAKGIYYLPSNGKLNKNGLVVAFPSRALYEQYPLDPYTAWMKWQEEQTIFHIRIEFQPYEERGEMKCGNMGTLHFNDLKLRTPADRDKCIEEIKTIIEKYK